MECAKAAARSKNSYLASQYKRICARRGRSRATVAVGHSILIIAYHILKDNADYAELGAPYFELPRKQEIVKRSVKRLEALGLKVTIQEQIEEETA